MTGTTYTTGVSLRKTYNGTTDSADTSRLAAATKFLNRTAVIRCFAQTSATTANFTLPASAIVRDVFINVITADATETVDVGTSSDANGFLVAASLATAGVVFGSLADAAVTRGALLFEITEATTAAARKPDVTSGGDTISYQCSAGSDTAVFDIIIEYVEVLDEIN